MQQNRPTPQLSGVAGTSMPDNIFRTTASAANARASAPGPTMIPAPSVSQTNPARVAHVDNSSTPAMISTRGLDPAQRPSSHPWVPMGLENGWAQRQPAPGPMQVCHGKLTLNLCLLLLILILVGDHCNSEYYHVSRCQHFARMFASAGLVPSNLIRCVLRRIRMAWA
jgi:hypothetical protein